MTYRSLLIVCLATLGLAVAGWGQTDGKIAFLSYRENYENPRDIWVRDVWIMNADGSDPVNLTQGQYCASPVWSPDGTKIAYMATGDDYSGRYIWVVDAAGGKRKQLTDDIEKVGPNSADDLFWSEDGSSVYYHVWDRSELFAVALDGSGSSLMEWTEAALLLRRFWDRRNFSPDGTKRATTVLLRGDEYEQALLVMASEDWKMTSKDRVPAILLSGQPVDLFFQDYGDSWILTGFPLTWAPNGTRVAFTSYTILSSTDTSYSFTGDGEIWAVDIDGSNLINLTNGLGGDNPVWQPVSPSATATSVEVQSWGRIKALHSTGSR
jgi:Tol biopolymer transport system component